MTQRIPYCIARHFRHPWPPGINVRISVFDGPNGHRLQGSWQGLEPSALNLEFLLRLGTPWLEIRRYEPLPECLYPLVHRKGWPQSCN